MAAFSPIGSRGCHMNSNSRASPLLSSYRKAFPSVGTRWPGASPPFAKGTGPPPLNRRGRFSRTRIYVRRFVLRYRLRRLFSCLRDLAAVLCGRRLCRFPLTGTCSAQLDLIFGAGLRGWWPGQMRHPMRRDILLSQAVKCPSHYLVSCRQLSKREDVGALVMPVLSTPDRSRENHKGRVGTV